HIQRIAGRRRRQGLPCKRDSRDNCFKGWARIYGPGAKRSRRAVGGVTGNFRRSAVRAHGRKYFLHRKALAELSAMSNPIVTTSNSEQSASVRNPTHGSGWMVQVQPTTRARRPPGYYSFPPFSSRLRGKE